METIDRLRGVLRDALQLGQRAQGLSENSPLMGAIPELDSMAVVTVLTMIEDQFGFTIADDEITADSFATLGSLLRFVEGKRGR